jgi:hypothetical protein
MRVFHGSDTFIDVINLEKCKPNKDFGRGFYVTKLAEQAQDMADRVARWGDKKPAVTEFEFDETAFEDEEINALHFNVYDEQWLDFIILNRNKSTRKNIHEYDIVEGPVADDAVSIRIDAYLDGLISKPDFLEELKYKNKITHQICFCTVRSLQFIKRINAKPDGIFYFIDDKIVKQLIVDFDLPEMQATDRYFSSKTYKKLINEQVDLSHMPWPEIYEELKKELKIRK